MKTTDFLTELSTDKLAQYKTAAAADASKADKEGDFKRGDKRFSGIVKATKKQFANDTKQDVAEMDSQSPKGRMKSDGARSHSTYGSRDHYSDSDPQHTAKPTTAKKTIKQATDIFNKAFKDVDKKQGVAEGSERSIYKQAYMDGYNGKSFNSPYKPGSDEDDEYDEGWHDGRLDYEKQDVAEGWSKKYKSSINCSHPKGFSQKAHCAGKKKHNESIEMEMVCEDCGMCETHINHENLDEACWKGYHKEGNKKMFGKTYPNCVKNTNEEQHDESCPHCGGEMVSEELMNEKKDACYYKVKSRYKVWPSAYASGALVKCRNKGASNWGNGGKKNESSILEGIEQADESLHDWFNKEKWVRMDTKGNIKGPCAKEPGEGKPKCLPQSKAHSLGKKGRASAAARKRREDPNPERSGKAINVNTKKKD
jgi:hypothetical protein